MRAFDWSRTPFGPVASWPQSLRTAVSIMLASPLAMVVTWGPERRMFYNDRITPMLGSKHPHALGLPIAESCAEIWHLVEPELDRIWRGEPLARDDWHLPLARNGYLENAWFTVANSPIRDETGDVGGVLAVVVETTGRVEGERRLATLRELAALAAGARTSDDACTSAAQALERNPIDVPFAIVYSIDDDGRRARLRALAGLPAGHAAAPEIVDLAAPGGWPLDRAVAGETVVIDEVARLGPLPGGAAPEPARQAVLLPLTRPGLGHPHGVMIAGVSPRRALDDRYRGFFELAADHIATAIANARALEEQHRRAEALVELQRQHSRALFGRAPLPICILRGPSFVIDFANEQCCAMLAKPPSELLGRPLFETLPETPGDGLRELLRGVLETGEPYIGRAARSSLLSRSTYFDSVYQPMRGADGTVEGLLVFAIDVTDQVHAREELRRSVDYHQRFVSMLGHDLRNPLNTITTTAQLLQRRARSAEISTPAARILVSGARMERMIEQLLDLARLRVAGGLRLQPRPIDLGELSRLVVDELRAAHPTASLELVTTGTLHGEWDGDRLAQVLANVAGNAVEHGAPEHPVLVAIDGSAYDTIAIRVESGGAIPEAMLPTLFDPFYRDQTRGRRAQGLGLGLYISKAIVAAHHGTIAVESTAARGTRFEIRIPKNSAA